MGACSPWQGEIVGLVGESGLREIDARAGRGRPGRTECRPGPLPGRTGRAMGGRPAVAAPVAANGVPGPVLVAQPEAPARAPDRRRHPPRYGGQTQDDEAATRVAALLERVGLRRPSRHRYPHEFSGGQCQRIAIARVLATEPGCVVADEPISSTRRVGAGADRQPAGRDRGRVRPRDAVHFPRPFRGAQDRSPHVVMYFGRIVEAGATEPIWAEPAHPYTRALIAAVPEPGAGSVLPSELNQVTSPNPARPPPGCRFHPRCPVAIDRCRTDDPPPVEVEPGWQSLCFLSEPLALSGRRGCPGGA